MADRSERSASNRVVIGTTAVQIFEGLVQYRLWVALLCLAGTCFSPQTEVKLLPEQSGVQLLQPDGFELTRASVLAHLRATGGAAVRRDQGVAAPKAAPKAERAPQRWALSKLLLASLVVLALVAYASPFCGPEAESRSQ